MQRLAISMAAAAAVCCAATAAHAQHFRFSPSSTAFTASGPADITKGTDRLQCTMNMTMKTNAKGKLKILSATFSGDNGCGSGENLPWKVVSTGFNAADIKHFEFVSSFGDCSYPLVPLLVDGPIVIISFEFPDCGAGLGAEMTTTPTLSIVEKGANADDDGADE